MSGLQLFLFLMAVWASAFGYVESQTLRRRWVMLAHGVALIVALVLFLATVVAK